MKRLLILSLVLAALSGCTSSAPVINYERDELVAVQHNSDNMMTLLTYRDPLGQTRHVLRRNGVFQFALTYTLVGKVAYMERGGTEREISGMEASAVTDHINLLFRGKTDTNKLVSNI